MFRIAPVSAPTPTAYPLFRDGKPVGKNRRWSIRPVCGCVDMAELSLNCCCAVAFFPCLPLSWGGALQYGGVGSTFAAASNILSRVDFGNSGLARGAEAVAKINALLTGSKKRRELIQALGLRREGDSYFLRCLCGPFVQCQEIDTVFVFYRDSLGYRDLRYGPWTSCACTRWYTDMPSTAEPGYSGPRTVPFPDEIERGEAPGPNYPPSEFKDGFFFEAGVPKPHTYSSLFPAKEKSPSNVAPPRYPLLPGDLLP